MVCIDLYVLLKKEITTLLSWPYQLKETQAVRRLDRLEANSLSRLSKALYLVKLKVGVAEMSVIMPHCTQL